MQTPSPRPPLLASFHACVHRGTREIGGSCIELAVAGERLVLDLGLPLDADPADDPALLLPEVQGLRVPNPTIPAAGWPNLAVYVPQYQRRHIARTNRFDLLAPYKPHRIYPEALAALSPRAVMLFRPAMLPDLDALGAELWVGARAIWSQWDGYLRDEAAPGAKLRAALAARGVGLEVIHTSGHASIADLKRLVAAIGARSLVPVHTFAGGQFQEHFGTSVMRRGDGEWWEV